MYRESRAQKAKREEIYYVFFGFVLLAIAFAIVMYFNQLNPHHHSDSTDRDPYGTIVRTHDDGPANR